MFDVRQHREIIPFLHGIPGGLLRLRVPPARQPVWTATIAAIETELVDRTTSYRQAALGYLTLLLVDVARLATDVVGDLRRSDEPLLAEVFDVIEQRFTESLSLRDVAESVGVTPGYLTTLVRRRTGRTVVDWIIERRMVQARQLLTETDLPVSSFHQRWFGHIPCISSPGVETLVTPTSRVGPRQAPRKTPADESVEASAVLVQRGSNTFLIPHITLEWSVETFS